MSTSTTIRTFEEVQEFAYVAKSYHALRAACPEIPAYLIHGYLRSDGLGTLEQYICERTQGHRWSYTGTAYGGDDDRYHGEGRALCSNCGADGDA